MMGFYHAGEKSQKGPTERRKYVRLDASIPVHYFVIPEKKEEEIVKNFCHKAQSRNIGGGGLLIDVPVLTDELFFTTHLIKVQFSLPQKTEFITAIARMISVEKPKHVKSFYVRLAFIKISKEDRQSLIDYINKECGKP